MSYIKFLTICDDAFGTILTPKIRLRYEISLLPTRYTVGECASCYDIVNSSGEKFAQQDAAYEIGMRPNITPSLFSYCYQLFNANGYDALYVLCPHSKWYPYYESARNALQAFKRTKIYPGEDVFSVHVIDTKSFALGNLFYAYRLARESKLAYCDLPTMDFLNKSFQKNTVTLILSNFDNSPFARRPFTLNAVSVSGNTVKELAISESAREVQYDRFAQLSTKAIRKADGKYLVSFGSDCSFLPNILGRIEALSGYTPVACGQYGIATTAVLGAGAFCVHLF